jgi:hypothetical protein
MKTEARIVTFFAIRTIGETTATIGEMVNERNENLYLLPADKEGMMITSVGNYIHWGPKFKNPIKKDSYGRRFFITPIAGELAKVIRERSANLVEYIRTPKNTPLELILKPEVPATIVKFIDERNFVRILTKDSGLKKRIKENLRKEQWTMLRCPYAIKVKISRVQEINDLMGLCLRSVKQIQEAS